MNVRLILLVVLLVSQIRIVAQPPETTYFGNIAVEGYTDDGSYGPFDIGFSFSFFNNNFTQFFINSNGQILFGSGSLESAVAVIPSEELPDNFIAPFWDDLVIDSYGKILYRTIGVAPNRKLIVQFKNMGFYPSPANLGTFSVILYETSNIIQFQYRLIVLSYSAKAHGGSASIGLEDSTGTRGVQYAFNNPSAVNSEQAITFTPVAGPSYTVNSGALYDGIFLTTNLTLPEPGIANLISPAQDGEIGSDFRFEWSAAQYAASYNVYIGTDPELIGAVGYQAGSNLSIDIAGLDLNETYYWGVFSQNATGTTWCEIKRFTTSSSPPLTAVPQTIWVAQGQDKTIKLNSSGGDGTPRAAIISSLPGQGQLYQYISGVRGNLISSIPTTVTDAGMNVIYAASGSTGNGVGSFNFKINQSGSESPDGLVTVNVSPPGVPSILYLAKSEGVELQFDRTMADPAGKESMFEVKVDGNPVTISSLSLKEGDPFTLVLTLSSALTGTETVLVSYTQGDIVSTSGGALFSFSDQPVTLTAQTISFSQSLDTKFSDSPFTFMATSASGLGMTYSSGNLAVATIVANIATFRAIGTSEITARQTGDATYAPAKYIKTLSVAKGDQTITFNALPVKNVGDANFSPGAEASSGLPLTYISFNTAVATIISGNIHIVASGSAVINASQAGNTLWNAATSVSQTLTVAGVSSDKTLNISSLFLESLYNGAGTMRRAWNESGPLWPAGVADQITVELHSATNYSTIVYTVADVSLSIIGTATVTIPASYNNSYYITVKHRNSIETTTASPVSFTNSVINQVFGVASAVYGANLKASLDSYNLIYGGDVNQNGLVESFDMTPIDNLSSTFGYGLSEDVNCDGLIDSRDMTVIDNNNSAFVSTVHP